LSPSQHSVSLSGNCLLGPGACRWNMWLESVMEVAEEPEFRIRDSYVPVGGQARTKLLKRKASGEVNYARTSGR
jgi:hypothetical protein